MRFSLVYMLMLVFKTVVGQIPNNSFETWNTKSGYSSPANWDNLNQITSPSGIFTCLQGNLGNPTSSYLFLISKTVPGKGVVPGIAVSGKLDTSTYKPLSGYPYTNRPQFLNYKIQYMPFDPSDSSSVKIILTKWNTTNLLRDTIAYGASYYNAMAHSWFVGSTYLDYQSGEAPDSALIVLSSSSNSPNDGSYIYLDSLQFIGSVIGINEQSINQDDISIYPNPTMENFSIDYTSKSKSEISVLIYDSVGRIVSSSHYFVSFGSNLIQINFPVNYNQGIYLVKVVDKENIILKKIVLKVNQ